MLHSAIKFAYVVIALFAATMAFLIMRNFDEVTVAGPSTVVRVNESENVASGQQVTTMIESFAREHRVNIGREVPDLQRPDSIRHLYLAVGDPGADSTAWLEDGYPGFSRSMQTEVHPIHEISDRDPRAYYLIFGPADTADDLLHSFSEQGLHGWQQPFFTASRALEFFGNGALLWCVIVVALVVVVVVGSGVILNTKAYGVHRLHGHSFARILAQDMQSLAVYLLRTATILIPIIAILLFSYNGLNQVRNFALTAWGSFLFFTTLAATVHVACLALVHRAGVLGSLKGHVSATSTMSVSYVIRVPALFLALAATTSVVAAGNQVIAQRSELAAWSRAGDAVYVLLNGSLGSDSSELSSDVGAWIRASSEQGQAVLSHREPLQAILPPGINGPRTDALVVNGSYLAEQHVVDPSGDRIAGPGQGDSVIQVLIPEKYWSESDQIAASVADWATFLIDDRQITRPEVQPVKMRNEQSLFTYDSLTLLDNDDDLRPRDPVVVAMPNGSEVLPADQYTAYATQGGVVFRNSDYVLRSMSQDGLSEYILAVNPVAEQAASEYRASVRELRLRAFNLIASLAVLWITATSVAIVYCRKNSQSLFVKYISGWSFTRAYRPILALELAVSLLLVSWSLFVVWSSSRDAGNIQAAPSEQRQLALGGWELLAASVISVLSVAFVVAALLRFNGRMVKEQSSDA